MPRWYQAYSERFNIERKLLNEAGFVLDENALAVRNRVEFVGSINDSKQNVAVRIVCPEGFPYRIPSFIAPDLKLDPDSRHISFRTHAVCLRLIEPNGWDFEDHIVSLIDDARRVLVGQHTKNFGEEHRAPDQDLFGNQLAAHRILVPEDLQFPPSGDHFVCNVNFIGRAQSVLLLKSIGDRTTSTTFGESPRPIRADVFRLRQIPINFVCQLDDTFGTPRPDILSMLREYACDRESVERFIRSFPKNRKRGYVIGAVFPFQGNETVWQFFNLIVERGRETTELIATHFLKDLLVRISPSVDSAALGKTRVLVVGAGALGSTIALELACAGVGHIQIFDSDRIAIGNIPRHEASLLALGKFKVQAVRELVLLKNPHTKVTPVPMNIFDDPTFEESVRSASIVAVTVGDENTERYVNDVCVRAGVPAVYAYVGMHASVGHVVRTIPSKRETGCLECFSRLYYTKESVIPRLPEPQDPNEVIVELGCNNPSLPGAGFDIKTVALAAVRKIIQTVLRESGGYPDDKADIIVLATRAVEGAPYHSLFVKRFELPSNSNCSTCGQAKNLPSS